MDEKLLIMEWITPFYSSKKFTIKILSLLLSLGAFSATGHATSFGAIPVAEQAEHATYVVRGYIEGQSVEADRKSGRPYTHWKFRNEEQMQGPDQLPGSFSLRQPGGELNSMGYQMAGTAQFSYGEHVVVMAKKTTEPGVVEVYGLASGKYTVVDKNGKQMIESALSGAVTYGDGSALSLDDFRGLIARVKSGDPTGKDLSVVVNREAEHDDREHTAAIAVADLSGPGGGSMASIQDQTNLSPSLQDKDITIRQPSSEKSLGTSETVWTKITAIVLVLIAFLLVAVFFVRKPNH